MMTPIHYKFGFRLIKKGNFKGLWELIRYEQDGTTVAEIMVDADNLSRNIGEISKYFELLGY